MNILGRARWSQRNKLAKLALKTQEPKVIRRALAIGYLARGQQVSQVAESLCVARWAVYSRPRRTPYLGECPETYPAAGLASYREGLQLAGTSP